MRKYLPSISIIALYLATLLMLPRVDHIEPSVFFYLKHLPIIYHICLLTSILLVIFGKQRIARVIAACVLSLLIIWTPSIMLVQPWHLDSYPFLAEAVYISRNGHIGNFHYLQENPILGLTFGPYLLTTGINPITLLKIYPAFIAILFVTLIYVIAENLKIGTKAAVIAPILLVSILWPHTSHFSRFGFSLTYYLISLLLLSRLVFGGADRRFLMLLVLEIFILSVTHPATPLYFMFNLFSIIFLGRIFYSFSSREHKLLISILAITSVAWILWNMLGTNPEVVYSLRDIGKNVIASVSGGLSEVSGVATIVSVRTLSYRFVIDARLLLTLCVYIGSFFIPFLIYRRMERKILLFLMGWSWSNIATLVPLLFVGLSYFQKPTFFAFASWGPLAAAVWKRAHGSRLMKILSIILIVFTITSSFLIPLVKYGSLSLEYPTTRELAGKEFLDSHASRDIVYVYFEDPAYFYSYIVNGYEPRMKATGVFTLYSSGEGLNRSVITGASVWITSRILARDTLASYSPSWRDITENATQMFPMTTHSKVYDNGWPEYILAPIPKRK